MYFIFKINNDLKKIRNTYTFNMKEFKKKRTTATLIILNFIKISPLSNFV